MYVLVIIKLLIDIIGYELYLARESRDSKFENNVKVAESCSSKQREKINQK